jgi:hydrogen peroxide-dependent heme synthase
MATTIKPDLNTGARELHGVPLTLEGSSVLHQMFRFRWAEWRKLTDAERHEITVEAANALEKMEHEVEGQSALFSLLAKGDLLLVHFRNSFDQLKQAELQLARLKLSDYLELTSSYLSVVELGLYESSVKLYRSLREKGIEPHTPEWDAAIEDTMKRQTEAMRPRLFPQIPASRYICFYPMDRRRGEDKNWYSLPIEERQRQMEEHGLVGRRYAGTVKQIITGSMGFDDWEWGVDLFADNPLIFKKLIYEMRFDEVSAVYALFGKFYVGVRVPAAKLEQLFSGTLPK